MRALVFSITLLVSSFLLFLVQPMIGRMLLPSLGGTPAVWNGCVLFFQAVLLAGYAWAHYGPAKLGFRNHLFAHLILLAMVCFLLPMRLVEGWSVPTESNQMGWLIGQLTLCVGLPFFAISSSSPLLQRWFEASSGKDKSEPWFLYAVSNVGSLAALASYPFVFERFFGLTDQGWFWTAGFMLLAILFVISGWLTVSGLDQSQSTRAKETQAEPIDWARRIRFIILAAIPSSLMLGVTTVVSTEVGSFPLMWSIPLALYLLTFVFVFSKRNPISHRLMVFMLPGALLLMPLISMIDPGENPRLMISVHFSLFFLVAMVCHGELNRLKPNAKQLTEFYMLMSIGGVVGGAINSLVAPNVFSSILEYPLMLIAACLVVPSRREMRGESSPKQEMESDWFKSNVGTKPLVVAAWLGLCWLLFENAELPTLLRIVLAFGLPAVLCLTLIEAPKKFAVGYALLALICPSIMEIRDVVTQERGFFGVNEVAIDDKGEYIMLVNGRTLHGMQRLEENENPEPLTYYHNDGPTGDVFRLFGDGCSRVAGVGLGVGSLAAYATEGQDFDFYEIDPVVCRFASDKRYFSYLSSAKECGANVNVILGDARMQLDLLRRRLEGEKEEITGSVFQAVSYRKKRRQKYQLMVMDAFGSDSVPLHLLTKEAIELYLDVLEEDGLLVFHVSSKFMNFQPIGAGIAELFELKAAIRSDVPDKQTIEETGRTASLYIVMSRNAATVDAFLDRGTGWQPLTSDDKLLWTDEHTNVLDIIRW